MTTTWQCPPALVHQPLDRAPHDRARGQVGPIGRAGVRAPPGERHARRVDGGRVSDGVLLAWPRRLAVRRVREGHDAPERVDQGGVRPEPVFLALAPSEADENDVAALGGDRSLDD